MFPSMNSRPNFTSQNVTKHPAKLSTLVPIFPILFCYPHFSIRTFPSAFFHPQFSIRIFPSAFFHPPSAIRHPPPSGPHFTETLFSWCSQTVSVKRRLQTADCRLQTADCRLQTGGKMQTDGKMQTADQG